MKYSENLLRARLGMRSRLGVGELDEEYRRIIDTYYRVISPTQQAGKKKESKVGN